MRTDRPSRKSAMNALGVVPWTARAGSWQVVSIGSGAWSWQRHSSDAWRAKGFWLSHVDSADRAAVEQCLADAVHRAPENPAICEYRFVDGHGQTRWIRTAMTSRAGSPDKVTGYHLDITAERRAAQFMPVLDNQYEYALDVAGVRLWQRDAHEVEGWMPPSITSLAGIPAETPVSYGDWLERVHPRDRRRVSEHSSHGCADDVAPTGRAQPLSRAEYRVRHVNGSIRWLASTLATVTPPDGSGPRVFGTVADVTDRVRERRARRTAERLYHDIWESFPGSAAVIDSSGVIVEVNPTWARMGATRSFAAMDAQVGTDYFEAARALAARGSEYAAQALEGMKSVMAGTCPLFTLDYTCELPGNTEERWFRLRVMPLHRSVRGVIVMHDDITERVMAERATQRHREDLTHMQRLATLGELATSIAHELNQPLAAIMASASTARRILRDRGDVEPLKPIVNDILESAARAADVVRRARAMVRHDSAILESVSVNDVVNAVVRLIASDLVIHQVSLKLELDPAVRPVIGDHIQLQQVLLNLLLNAVDALDKLPRERRNVIVSTRQIGDRSLELQVRDTGLGIAPEIATRVFEPFVTTKRKGTGLGLAIVRAIVHAHGGEVFAGTGAEGGAAFRVVFSNP